MPRHESAWRGFESAWRGFESAWRGLDLIALLIALARAFSGRVAVARPARLTAEGTRASESPRPSRAQAASAGGERRLARDATARCEAGRHGARAAH